MTPPGFSLRAIFMDCVVGADASFLCFFFFDFLYMPPPGFSSRAICMVFVVVDEFNSHVSLTGVELVAWAESDRATRPAAPKSAVRMNDFMCESSLVYSQKELCSSSANPV